MKISTIVFDLDGTLMDTLQDLAESTNYALREYGFPQHSIEAVRSFVGNGVRKLMERAVPQGTENPMFEDVFRTFKEHYVAHCRDHSGLYDGIADMLQSLADSGYQLAVVSNKLQAGVTELQQSYFSSWIKVAVGERPEVRRKPAPDMVFQAIRELGADLRETVYVGDSDVDIETARQCGIPCISVLWGFRDREFLEACGAAHFAATPQDIVHLIRRGLE